MKKELENKEIDSAIETLLNGNEKCVEIDDSDWLDVLDEWDSYKCRKYPVAFLSYYYCCGDEHYTHAYWALVIPVGDSKFILSCDEYSRDELLDDINSGKFSLKSFGKSEDFEFNQWSRFIVTTHDLVDKPGCYKVHKTQYAGTVINHFINILNDASKTLICIITDPAILQEIEEFRNMKV